MITRTSLHWDVLFIFYAQFKKNVATRSLKLTSYGNDLLRNWRTEFKACGQNAHAEYGKRLLEYISEHLTAEFGKGFDKLNLRNIGSLIVLFQF